MFCVEINLVVPVLGCPTDPIGIVDFRRANGLPDSAEKTVKIYWEGVSESLCRQFPGLVNSNANLKIKNPEFYGNDHPLRVSRYATVTPVTPAILRPFTDGFDATEADVVALLEVLTAASREYHASEAIRKEKEAKHRAESEAKHRADKALREAAEAAKLESLRAWALDHGSELTKLRLEGGFDCWVSSANGERQRIADQEADATEMRIIAASGVNVVELPDYDDWEIEDRKCPTLPELQSLAAVKSVKPANVEAKLVRVKYTKDDEKVFHTEIQLLIPHEYADEPLERYLILANDNDAK